MGLSSSPYIFTQISNFITRCDRNGIVGVINYLDDFVVAGHDWRQWETKQLHNIGILRFMGFFINFTKLASPLQRARFLGIEIDTKATEVCLPQEKIPWWHPNMRTL